jgi:DNA-binding NtrC family response regulator
MAETKVVQIQELRVLVVDDDTQMQELITSMLRSEGIHQIATTTKPVSALELVQQGQVDAMILDWKIPDVPNLGLMRAVHKHNKLIPIIMISGFAEQRNVDEAMKAGAVAYLQKPFNQEAVRRALTQAVTYISNGGKIPFSI